MVRWFRQTGLGTTTAAGTAKMVVTVMLVMLHCVLVPSASRDDLTTQRQPLVLGDTCSSPTDCQKYINRSTCASGVCVCARGYFKKDSSCYAVPRNLTVTQRIDYVNIFWEGDNIEHTVYINISNKYNRTFKMFEVIGTQVDFSPSHPGSVIEVMVTASGSNSSTGTANVTIAPSSPERLNITFVNDTCMEAEWSPGTGVTELYIVNVMYLGKTTRNVTTQTTWSSCGLPPGEQFYVHVYAMSNSVLSRVPSSAFDYTNPSKPRDGRLQNTGLTNTWRVDIWWSSGSNKDKEFVVTVEKRTDIKPSVVTPSGPWYTSRIHISYGSRFTISIQAVKHGKKSLPLQMTGCTAPGTVERLTVVSSGYNWIKLEWSPPAGDVDSFEYEVTVHKHRSRDRVDVTDTIWYRVGSLTPGTNYTLTVRVKFCNLTSDYTTVSGATSLEEPRNLTVTQRNNSVNISWFGDNIEYTVYINISNKYNTTFKMFEVTGTQLDFSPIHPGSVIEVMVSVSGSNSSTGTANVTIAPSSPERLNITFVNDTCMEAEWSPGTGVTELYRVHVMYLGRTTRHVTTQTTWTYCGLSPGELFNVSVYAMSNSFLSRVPASAIDYTNPSKPRDGRLHYISLTSSSRVDISWIPGSNKDKEFVVTVENRTDIKPTVPTPWGSRYLSRIHISYGSRFTISIQAVNHGKKSLPLQMTGCTAPGRVEGLNVVSSGYNWIELEWSSPAGDVDSFEYEVTVHKLEASDRVDVTDTIPYRVGNLTPGTNYTLKVRVKFCNLTSDYTTVSGATSLEGLSKFEVHTSPDSPVLNITWEHPLRDKGGLAFLLTVSENNETVIYNQNITQSPLSVSVNSFGKCFRVTLIVTGTSRRIPETKWKSTPEKAPGPVVDLSSSRLTQDRTSLFISWSRPEVTNGIITEYRLSVTGTRGGNYLQTLTCQGNDCKLHCGNKHRTRKATVQGGSTSYFSGEEKHFSVLLKNLSLYENYDIRVTASTSQFTGPDVLLRTDDQYIARVEDAPTVLVVVVVVCLIIIFCLSAALCFTLKRLRRAKVDVAEQVDRRDRDSIPAIRENLERMKHRTEISPPLPYRVKKSLGGSRGGNAQNETANGNEGERTSKKSDSSTSSPGQAAGNGSKSGGSTPRSSSSGSDKPSTNPNYTSTALQEVEIHPYMDLHTRDPTYASTTSSKDPHMYMELKTLKALQPGSEKNGNDGYETPQVPGQANKSSDGYETPQPPREGRRRSATYANQGVPADPIQEEVNYYNEA